MKVATLLILLCTSAVYGQNDYYFGYQAGFKYGCSCNDLPPKNAAYYQGSYNDGYLDGKIDGVKYSTTKTQSTQENQSSKPQTNTKQPTTYNPDYELIEKALAQKQAASDKNWSDLTNRLATLIQLVNKLKEKNGNFTAEQTKYLEAANTQIIAFNSWDMSIQQNYTTAANFIATVQNQVIAWL